MNPASVAFTVVAGAFLAALPRRKAVVPLLLAAVYTTRLPVVELGPANLSPLRVLVVIGIARVLARREWIANGVNAVDCLLFTWAIVLIGSSIFHTSDVWTIRLGVVLGELGVYFLCRVFVRDAEEVRRLFAVLCLALVPVAVLMLVEKHTGENMFSVLGAATELNIRDGQIRAYGPFEHPILAGDVGAALGPMALCLWRSHRVRALIGAAATAGIVYASASTGPIMMAFCSCAALLMWRWRSGMQLLRVGTVTAIIALQLVMNDPVYFLPARIDIVGGSTGWHRAELIRSSIAHIEEWWAAGTDYTRHWMPTGIPANEFHTDITSHYLMMGVWGGLPLLSLFALMLAAAFRTLGRAVAENEQRSRARAFLIWTLGAMLFGHVVNFWGNAIFDQSVSFFYLTLASIGAVQAPLVAAAVTQSVATARPATEWRSHPRWRSPGRKARAAVLPRRPGLPRHARRRAAPRLFRTWEK